MASRICTPVSLNGNDRVSTRKFPQAGACTLGDKRAWSGRRGLDSLLQRAKADIRRGNRSLRGLRGKVLAGCPGRSAWRQAPVHTRPCIRLPRRAIKGTILSALWALALVENDESPLAILCSNSTTGSPGHDQKVLSLSAFRWRKGAGAGRDISDGGGHRTGDDRGPSRETAQARCELSALNLTRPCYHCSARVPDRRRSRKSQACPPGSGPSWR